MDWLLETPKMQSAFASLGSLESGTYVVSPNALAILEEINSKLTYEDQALRTFRRAIGYGHNIRTDLIPLLENAKDDDVLNSVIRILVNLTVPVECLFSVDVMYRTEIGRLTVLELNMLLFNSKEAFTDARSTKSVVGFMKHILESDPKLSPQKCDQINNCLVLLRNILHIPETNPNHIIPNRRETSEQNVSMQNAIMWNLFIQSIDKLLLHLITCPQRSFWSVTMVQLISLMYKDQHVSTLQKLLNIWFEASLSESSEDNESNTTPPMQASGDSSPMLTSDPTSDSSDTGGGCKNEISEDRFQALRDETEATLQEVSRKGHEYQSSLLRVPTKQKQQKQKEKQHQQSQQTAEPTNTAKELEEPSEEVFKLPKTTFPEVVVTVSADNTENCFQRTAEKVQHSNQMQLTKGKSCPQKRQCASSQSELSDCGYGTQIESVSNSSNDYFATQNKPVHQKPPCNTKPRVHHRAVVALSDFKDIRRKKLVKRSKSSLINMKGLVLYTPTEEDITYLLKEFTVDFLLKGYDCLVESLHVQLLTDTKMFMDTSHFFWLIAYFLKFAAQLELDLEHINSILTFDVISYLTYEGTMLCEQLELNSRQTGSDLRSYLRRIHLAVTAIKEFLQAIGTYKKVSHMNEEDQKSLQRLEVQISLTDDLPNLFVLLIRTFNPNLHTKQYLQDLIVTNHMLLETLDGLTNEQTSVNTKMINHILQFATPEIMYCYGILLEDFNTNGEFVNDCIFTMMHHIAGDLNEVNTLFQPIILKTFSRILEADYELCDDWSDLIEYVINKFMNTPQKSRLNLQNSTLTELTKEHNLENTDCSWTQEEMNILYWYYIEGKKTNDIVGSIVQHFQDNGNKEKSRISVIQQLLQQDIIALLEYDNLMKFEDAEYYRSLLMTRPTNIAEESASEFTESAAENSSDEFQALRALFLKEKKGKYLRWVQKVLLECCCVKLTMRNIKHKKEHTDMPYVLEPVTYHCISKNESIPIVHWNSDQANIMLYQPFLLLLHKMGIQLPADAGGIFARIPSYWTADMMFTMAKKLGPLDKSDIKFDMDLLKQLKTCEKEPIKRDSLTIINENILTGRSNSPTDKNFTKDLCAKNNSTNSMMKYVSDLPTSAHSLPNWLQLVMRSKCSHSNKSIVDFTMPNKVFVSILTNASHMKPLKLSSKQNSLEDSEQDNKTEEQIQQEQPIETTNLFSDDDSSMKSLDRKDSMSSGFHTQRSGSGGSGTLDLDSEYCAMIASAFEDQLANDNIESDLARMYVSDDEGKGDDSD